MAYNIITDAALSELVSKMKAELNKKVNAETGKTLTANDLTNALKAAYDQAVTDVNSLKTAGVEKNKIETVKVNGIALTPDDARAVDVTVPTDSNIKTIVEGYGYQTADNVETAITAKNYQTATQVNAAIEGKGYQTSSQVQSAINEALEGITGIDLQVVDALPSTGVKGVIYLVPHTHGTNDIYDEYVWVTSTSKFEKIGSTDVDLSAYVKSTDFTEVGASEIDTLWDSVS